MEKVKNDMGVGISQEDPRFMTSLARGLEVLGLFEGADEPDCHAGGQGLWPVTLERGALPLYAGAARICGGGGSSLPATPGAVAAAARLCRLDPLARAGQPVVEAVRNRLNESSSLAMFDTRRLYDTVIYICRAETSRIISLPLLRQHVAELLHVDGRVLLAGLPPEQLTALPSSAPFPPAPQNPHPGGPTGRRTPPRSATELGHDRWRAGSRASIHFRSNPPCERAGRRSD